MKLTLTRKTTKTFYDLKPFGYFKLKFVKYATSLRTIPVSQLKLDHENAFPLTAKQEERIVAMMVKYKTDVLTDGGYLNFYTRTGSGLTPVSHEKFQQYREDDAFKELVNDGFEEQI